MPVMSRDGLIDVEKMYDLFGDEDRLWTSYPNLMAYLASNREWIGVAEKDREERGFRSMNHNEWQYGFCCY